MICKNFAVYERVGKTKRNKNYFAILLSGIPKKPSESKWVSSVQPKTKSFQVANKFKYEDLVKANKSEKKKAAKK